MLRSIRLIFVLAVGCSHGPKITPVRPEELALPVCVLDCAEAPSSGLDGRGGQINLLARSFLPRGTLERTTYAFNVYIYFSENSSHTKEHRRAVAEAVLSLFRDVQDQANLPVLGTTRAILYIPVLAEADARAIVAALDPELFLKNYDYDRAKLIGKPVELRTGCVLPAVALLAHPTPIGEPLDLEQLFVVDLSSMDSKDVEERVLSFRRHLESPMDRLQDFEYTAAPRARGFFESIAALAPGPC